MTVDLLTTMPHYAAHARPVWDALPEDLRGRPFDTAPRDAGDAILVASHRDLKLAERAGYERIAYLEHGIGQSFGNAAPGYPGGRGRGAIGLFLSPNETAAGMDRRAYPGARVEVVGDPRLDTLPARVPDGLTTVAISFHWNSAAVQGHEGRPAYGHYRKALPALAAAVHLIAHAHPRAAAQISQNYRKLGIEFVADFDEVCRRADLYVNDGVSTLYEFASTGRPVLVLNSPSYRTDVELGLRFWAASRVGINVWSPDDLVALTLAALRDDEGARRDREAALEITYAYRSGAGQRAAAAIVDWLGDVAIAA